MSKVFGTIALPIWVDGPARQDGCLQAEPGFFVAVPGSTEQIPCPGGYYQPDSGMESCIVVPKDSFSYMGSPNPSECPYEGYTDWEGANSANSCRIDFDSDGLLNGVDPYPNSGLMSSSIIHMVVILMFNLAFVVILLKNPTEVSVRK